MSTQVAAPKRAKNNFSPLAFVSQHQGIIADVWSVMDRTWVNLAFELGWALDAIPAGEHGKLKIELTDAQRYAIVPLLADMEFFRGLDLRAGSYDELHITGAKFAAMVARVRYIKKRIEKGLESPRFRIEIGRWVGIFGQRPRTDWQDGTVADTYSALSDAVKAHPWVAGQMELQATLERQMVQEKYDADDLSELTADGVVEPPSTEWRGAFATEFELGILALIIAYDGEVEVGEYEASHEDLPQLPGVPKHTVASCTVTLPDGTPVVVLNAPAVIRPKGAPRPTTISGAKYWLTRYAPVKGAKIVAVSGKTHWYRVIGDFERLVHHYHPDVTVFGLSESAVDSLSVFNNALAELVWLMQKAYDELIFNLTGRRPEM